MEINPALGSAVLVFDRERMDVREYFAAAERLGYRVAPHTAGATTEDRGLLVRLGICVALAMNAMMFAFAGYFGLAAETGTVADLFGWLGFAFASLAVVIGGPVFFRAAAAGLRSRVLHLALPISLGILLA